MGKVRPPRSKLDMGSIRASLHDLCQREINVTTKCELTQKQVYEMLTPADVRKILEAAAPHLSWYDSSKNYFIGCGWEVQVTKDAIGAPPMKAPAKNNSYSTVAELLEGTPYQHLVPLFKVRDQVIELHKKWSVVRHTIEWMDKNLSAKEIRYMLPAIKTLKGAEDIPDELTSDGYTPLTFMLPLIRETGVILAGAQFLPPGGIRPSPIGFTIRLPDAEMFDHQGVKVKADAVQYHV